MSDNTCRALARAAGRRQARSPPIPASSFRRVKDCLFRWLWDGQLPHDAVRIIYDFSDWFDGTPIRNRHFVMPHATAITLTPSGEIAIGADGEIIFWNLVNDTWSWIEIPRNTVISLAAFPNGVIAASLVEDGVLVADSNSGETLYHMRGEWDDETYPAIGAMTYGLLVVAQPRGQACAYEADSGALVNVFDGHKDDVVAFAELPETPEGARRLASGSDDGTMRVWDTDSGMCLLTLAGHAGEVNALDVMPGGYLVSGSQDETVRVWDASTGICLQTFDYHTGGVNTLAVLPDGCLVSKANDGTVLVWNADAEDRLVMSLSAGGRCKTAPMIAVPGVGLAFLVHYGDRTSCVLLR